MFFPDRRLLQFVHIYECDDIYADVVTETRSPKRGPKPDKWSKLAEEGVADPEFDRWEREYVLTHRDQSPGPASTTLLTYQPACW